MMVSIPYGKGKDDRLQLINDIIIIVSIPYGKGKDNGLYDPADLAMVSIPYGKGKEQHFALRFYYNP